MRILITFSNASYVLKEALNLLSEKEKDTIIATTVGPTDIIDRHAAHRVFNLIGTKDRASKSCNGGTEWIIKNITHRDADVTFVEQHETEKYVNGHYFQQPDYQKAIKKLYQEKVEHVYKIY